MDKDGRAYTNTLVDGKVYGPDGTRIQSDNGWDIVTVEEDVYKDSDYSGADLKENAKPVIMAGSSVIVNNSGKLKKNGKVKLDGVTYQVKNYAKYFFLFSAKGFSEEIRQLAEEDTRYILVDMNEL